MNTPSTVKVTNGSGNLPEPVRIADAPGVPPAFTQAPERDRREEALRPLKPGEKPTSAPARETLRAAKGDDDAMSQPPKKAGTPP